MPLKTNIGVSRKVADNNYGSRGASVNLEVELDSTLINEPERFHDRIRQVFRLAQQAIDEELGRQHGPASHPTNDASNGHAAPPSTQRWQRNGQHANGNGRAAANASRANNLSTPANSPSRFRASASAAWKISPRRCSASRSWRSRPWTLRD